MLGSAVLLLSIPGAQHLHRWLHSHVLARRMARINSESFAPRRKGIPVLALPFSSLFVLSEKKSCPMENVDDR